MMQPTSAKLLYSLRGRMIGPIRAAVPRLWNPDGRLHILPELPVADFIARLNDRQVEYVVLNLGVRAADELELLIRGDDDFEKLRDLVTEWPVGQRIDVYTVSPRNNTAYFSPLVERVSCNRIAVFPPYISEQLLERAVADTHGMKVLTEQDAFFACAYRAAYMESGSWDWQSVDSRPPRPLIYEEPLRRRAPIVGIELPEPLTPQSLDQMLNEHGWRPPLDLLEKAARWAPWIRYAFPELECEDEESRTPGIAVFFIRELAVQLGWKERVLATLADNGFELLLVKDLDEESRDRAKRWFRGGDWGAVNLRLSAGPPVGIVVGLDLHPRKPNAELRARQPEADNMNTVVAKDATRKLVKSLLPREEAFNPVHSSDSSHQAWTTIRLLLPEHEDELREKARQRRQAFATEARAMKAKRQRSRSFASELRAGFFNFVRGFGRRVLPRGVRSIVRDAYRGQLTAK
jgi:hypothetical protein